MTEETIEASIPNQHRYQQNAKIHRKVRRDCYPAYIYKHIISRDKFTDDSHTQVSDPDRYSALEKNDPFDIGTFDVRFSLNKKGRWNIADQLVSNIVAYQDDLMDVRVSYVKSILRDCGWTYKDDKWQESNRVFDTEYASVKDGHEIHKRTKRANKYDLMKMPKPPKKAGKERAVRGDLSVPDGDQETDSKIHVLYETVSTIWDGRIRDKRNKRAAQAKRRQRPVRSKTGKICLRARRSRLADISEMFENEEIDDNFVDDLMMETDDDCTIEKYSKHCFVLKPADFFQPWMKVPHKKADTGKENLTENYMRWLQTSSYVEYVDEESKPTCFQMIFRQKSQKKFGMKRCFRGRMTCCRTAIFHYQQIQFWKIMFRIIRSTSVKSMGCFRKHIYANRSLIRKKSQLLAENAMPTLSFE